MVGFKFSNGGRKCIRQILQAYQSGESVGYTVKSMEKDFAISSYPLEQTEFLYDSKQGTVDGSFCDVNHSLTRILANILCQPLSI